MKFSNHLNHLEYIYTIYQERSFTRAAEKLYISQPSLSLTIKKIENDIGHPIFERSGKEVSLTRIGERYIKAIEDIMRIQTRLGVEIDDILKLKNGNVVIGSTTFVSSYILPTILKRFKDAYPDVKIEVVVDQSTELENKLEADIVDIVIDNTTAFLDGYKYTPLLEERILLGIPRANPKNRELHEYCLSEDALRRGDFDFEGARKLPVSRLSAEKFLLMKRGNKLRQVVTRIFDESKIIPNISMEFDRLHTAVSYAKAEFGICFLTDLTVKFGERLDNLCLYLPDTDYSDEMLYVIHKKKYLSNAAVELVDFIRRAAQDL